MAETSISISITGLKPLLDKLTKLQQESVITDAMNLGALNMAAWSKQNRLSGPRPRYLGVKTGRLRSSISTTKAVHEGNEYIAKIGTNVEYAAIHEFGGFTGRNGATRIPARPFLQPALADQDNQQQLLNLLTKNINKALES